MLVPAWAGSTPRFAKPNGSKDPSMTLVITIANSEQPMATAATGSLLVSNTLADPAATTTTAKVSVYPWLQEHWATLSRFRVLDVPRDVST